MARPKQKWTSKEEEALSAGVKKHGIGKWKEILTDPQFFSALANRTNVDLKDKYRNLSGSDHGSSSTGKARRRAPSNKEMIYEVLSSIKDPNGTDVNTMVKFLEPKYEVPKFFRRKLNATLETLVQNGRLEKLTKHRYKVKDTSSGAETSQLDDEQTNNVNNCNEEQVEPLPTETLEDAALVAAFQVSLAINMKHRLVKTCENTDKLAKLLEDSLVMSRLAEELHEQCKKDGHVFLK